MAQDPMVEVLAKMHPDEDIAALNSFDLIYKFGSIPEALFYSELFWPTFVEVEGMVFLGSSIEDENDRDDILSALDAHGGNRRIVEEAFNYVEVPLLFSSQEGSDDREERLLTERLTAMWRARLLEQFPDKVFRVDIVEPDESNEEIGLCFFQVDGGRRPDRL